METRASHIAVGAFVLVLMLGALAFVIWVGKFSDRTAMVDHYIRFAGSVAGLDVGSNVLFGGIPIGHVVAVRVDPQNSALARVDVSVDANAPIKEDSKAVLAMQGITGGVLVEIERGSQAAPKMKPGAEILSQYSQLEQLLNGAPQLIAKATEVLNLATAFLSPENAASIKDVLVNVDKITTTLANDSGKIDELLTSGTDTLKEVKGVSADARQLIADLRGTLAKVGPQTSDALAQIRVLAENFSKTSERLNSLIDDNRQPIRDFTGTGLYELTQMITEVRLLAQTLNRVSIQIERDPARFFFGDRQKGFEAQ